MVLFPGAVQNNIALQNGGYSALYYRRLTLVREKKGAIMAHYGLLFKQENGANMDH